MYAFFLSSLSFIPPVRRNALRCCECSRRRYRDLKFLRLWIPLLIQPRKTHGIERLDYRLQNPQGPFGIACQRFRSNRFDLG